MRTSTDKSVNNHVVKKWNITDNGKNCQLNYLQKMTNFGYSLPYTNLPDKTMKLSLDYGNAQYVIRGYTNSSITVNDEEIFSSLVVMPDQLIRDWEHPSSPKQLGPDHLALIIEWKPEIILLGTGTALCFPSAELMATIMGKRIGFEVMDTGSACRTFNILSSEDRRVAAAIML